MTTSVRPEPRLVAYGLAAVGGVLAAVVLGRPGLLVVAVPFAALAALGVADRRPPLAGVDAAVATDRVTQGARVSATLVVRTTGAARHDVLHVPPPALRPATAEGPCAGVHLGGGRGAPGATGTTGTTGGTDRLAVELDAVAWGRHALGSVHVRSRRPWSLLVWDSVVVLPAEVRVLPPVTRLSRLVSPIEPAGLAGPHRSRARGHGSDVAELRPYRPGDRLRDVSWAATARSGQPWVAEHHPERTGTVVVLLDTLGEGAGTASPGFDRVAAVTWSLVSAHLRVGDRVGLLGAGPSVVWLPPAAGRRARLLLLDALLGVAGGRRWPLGRTEVRTLLPADALVVGVTMLQSEAFVAALARHRRQGRPVLALVLDPTGTSAASAGDGDVVDRAARVLWRGELDRRRAGLAGAGVPSAVLSTPAELPAALRTLARRPTHAHLRRAR